MSKSTITNRTVRRGVLILALGFSVLTGCSSGDDPTVEAGDSGTATTVADDAIQVWSDSLIAAVAGLEQEQATLASSVDAFMGTSQAATEVLQGNAATLATLQTALPARLPGDDLVASRYSTFADAVSAVETAAGALVSAPADGSLWRFAESRQVFADEAQSMAEACFALQEAMNDNELGLLGCVGLTDSVDAAQSIFDSQAQEGLDITMMIAEETGGAEPTYGPTEDRFTLDICGMMNRDPLGLMEVDQIAASTETARIDRGDGIAVLEIWVFPDKATRDQAEASLDTMASSAKECLLDGPLFTSVWTDTAIDRQQYGPFERYTQLSGFVHPEIETSEGTAYYQLAWAGEANVLAIYSGAGRGQHLSELEVQEAVGIAMVGGTRPPT